MKMLYQSSTKLDHAVLFALKPKVGEQLGRLEKEGIIKKVSHSDWAAPIVTPTRKRVKSEFVGTSRLLSIRY